MPSLGFGITDLSQIKQIVRKEFHKLVEVHITPDLDLIYRKMKSMEGNMANILDVPVICDDFFSNYLRPYYEHIRETEKNLYEEYVLLYKKVEEMQKKWKQK